MITLHAQTVEIKDAGLYKEVTLDQIREIDVYDSVIVENKNSFAAAIEYVGDNFNEQLANYIKSESEDWVEEEKSEAYDEGHSDGVINAKEKAKKVKDDIFYMLDNDYNFTTIDQLKADIDRELL